MRSALSANKSLVCFVTAGDPNLDCLPEVIAGLARGGADAVEVGIPFSDPIADGPVIQAASQRALDRGVRVGEVLEAVRSTRAKTDVPIILMTYYNPVLRLGLSEFAEAAKEHGADGVIVTDLTPEEAHPWCEVAARHDLDTVFLVAPTSTDARVRAACEISTGFVYCIARTGVTGVGETAWSETRALVDRVRAVTRLPALVGFGVRSATDVAAVHAFADGAIVGSALVQALSEQDPSGDLGAFAEGFARGLRP
ncbi:MAG: tryptophan synthase subunit alpha [Fimbriimonadia bacterium]